MKRKFEDDSMAKRKKHKKAQQPQQLNDEKQNDSKNNVCHDTVPSPASALTYDGIVPEEQITYLTNTSSFPTPTSKAISSGDGQTSNEQPQQQPQQQPNKSSVKKTTTDNKSLKTSSNNSKDQNQNQNENENENKNKKKKKKKNDYKMDDSEDVVVDGAETNNNNNGSSSTLTNLNGEKGETGENENDDDDDNMEGDHHIEGNGLPQHSNKTSTTTNVNVIIDKSHSLTTGEPPVMVHEHNDRRLNSSSSSPLTTTTTTSHQNQLSIKGDGKTTNVQRQPQQPQQQQFNKNSVKKTTGNKSLKGHAIMTSNSNNSNNSKMDVTKNTVGEAAEISNNNNNSLPEVITLVLNNGTPTAVHEHNDRVQSSLLSTTQITSMQSNSHVRAQDGKSTTSSVIGGHDDVFDVVDNYEEQERNKSKRSRGLLRMFLSSILISLLAFMLFIASNHHLYYTTIPNAEFSPKCVIDVTGVNGVHHGELKWVDIASRLRLESQHLWHEKLPMVWERIWNKFRRTDGEVIGGETTVTIDNNNNATTNGNGTTPDEEPVVEVKMFDVHVKFHKLPNTLNENIVFRDLDEFLQEEIGVRLVNVNMGATSTSRQTAISTTDDDDNDSMEEKQQQQEHSLLSHQHHATQLNESLIVVSYASSRLMTDIKPIPYDQYLDKYRRVLIVFSTLAQDCDNGLVKMYLEDLKDINDDFLKKQSDGRVAVTVVTWDDEHESGAPVMLRCEDTSRKVREAGEWLKQTAKEKESQLQEEDLQGTV